MNETRIRPVDVAEEMAKSFLDYSMSVIISRALPDARDGLKPSQRRVLYAMHELGLVPTKGTLKCARIVARRLLRLRGLGEHGPALVHARCARERPG